MTVGRWEYETAPSPGYCCSDCGFFFPTAVKLKVHLRRTHYWDRRRIMRYARIEGIRVGLVTHRPSPGLPPGYRRVQRAGNHSISIVLPMAWVRSNGVTMGQVVHLEWNGPKLVITAPPSPSPVVAPRTED